MKQLPLIDTLNTLKEKAHLLDCLKEIDITNSLMNICLTSSETATLSPLDTFYQLLKANITPLSENEVQYKIIQKMLKNTHGPTHDNFSLEITDIYAVERKEEALRFLPFKKLHNRSNTFYLMIFHWLYRASLAWYQSKQFRGNYIARIEDSTPRGSNYWVYVRKGDLFHRNWLKSREILPRNIREPRWIAFAVRSCFGKLF